MRVKFWGVRGSIPTPLSSEQLNAKLFQTNLTGGDKPPVHYNEYGGTIGPALSFGYIAGVNAAKEPDKISSY